MREILEYLPDDLAQELTRSPGFNDAEELRIRAKRNVSYYSRGCERQIQYVLNAENINKLVFSLAEHSLFSFAQELTSGFFTMEGGIRVGVAGRVVSSNSRIKNMRSFTSLNIRFPGELKGIAQRVMQYLICDDRLLNTIIISPPGHGKTTLLRDAVRMISDGICCAPMKCTVIDERSELYADGFDLGARTDILTSCPKVGGMQIALRALSPDVIAMDEVGSKEEVHSIHEAVNCGVSVIATAHAKNFEELKTRQMLRELMACGLIKRVVELGDCMGRGTLNCVYNEKGEKILGCPVLLEVD